MAEPLIPKKRGDEDESIASFARRRIGDEGFRILIDAMQSGIYAGDPERLSVAACFPRVVEVERQYGSLIRGMVALQLQRRKERGSTRGSASGAGPSGHLTTVEGGLQQMVDALARSLRGEIRCGVTARAVEHEGERYRVALDGGEAMHADRVLLAVPAYRAAPMVEAFDDALATMLREIDYAPMMVVCLGYRRQDVGHALDGFGFLAPRNQSLRILGALFSSTIFAGRAPDGHVLVRAMLGGARDRAVVQMNDQALIKAVRNELEPILRVGGDPAMQVVFRHAEAIPQYNVGHQARVERIEKRAAEHAGLLLTGNAFRGIGVNDCVRNAQPVADAVLAGL